MHMTNDRLSAGLRSRDSFTLRRCQIVLACRSGQRVEEIARTIGCGEQTVRATVHAFNRDGVSALTRKSHRPKTGPTAQPIFDQERSRWLGETIRKSPRSFGKDTSLWSTPLLAQAAFEQGVTERIVDEETVRRALVRLGVNWKRAKKCIASPDPAYERKKSDGTV